MAKENLKDKILVLFKKLLTFIKKITRKKEDKNPPDQKPTIINTKPVHPWRQCPLGQHWVRTHPLRVPPSKKHPSGTVTTRNEHCANNPTDKDHLYSDEIQEIAKIHFDQLKLFPLPNIPEFSEKGQAYDHLILGWTQYWNDILKPHELLDPLIIKALIASESSFNPKAWNKRRGSQRARGLMQVIDQTIPYLTHMHHELKDHFIHLTENDMEDPNLSICAGIRWLFRKKELAEKKLNKTISWREAVAEYKGSSAENVIRDFNRYYTILKGEK